ncbi:LUD domain-containing protein [Halostella pelagica]|uniref:LUD domain-containing protein n=1 Tax=Halostella pelagica TaxID=2583824 RepID=UPI001080FDF2|nr:LUD domain-containing protein [Halostella pelagica]
MTTIDTFEQSLADLPAAVDRVSSDGFDEALERCLERPAVGVSLPFRDLSLTDQPVETDPSPSALSVARTGVTPVGPAVAEYGSVVIPSGVDGAEQVSLYPDIHVGVLAASDIVDSLAEAVGELSEGIADGLTSAVFATGPSGTADMGSVVYGAHGPESVRVIVLEDR